MRGLQTLGFSALCFFAIYSLIIQNSLKEQIVTLKEELLKEQIKAINCMDAISKQNEAFNSLKIEQKSKNLLNLHKIKNIYIKDNSCQTSLNAYKDLFNEN